ncbi:MAG: EAL domain-containing protein [Thiofilum sp.]|uniref:putative bifunctional diguanylate cyclase/phosphodiesterase n=1 Tax=Thiofilum sp. TaxID=2212733 RepID=UPI0025D3D8FD|nr:EAL domain-containing protein [Thiofilum sp.]MBK8453236.1 EAL domain-containing protein [Thiofilum sp.]
MDSWSLLPITVNVSVLISLLLAVGLIIALIVLWSKYRAERRLQLLQLDILVNSLIDIDEIAVLVDHRGYVEFMNPAAEKLMRYRWMNMRNKPYRSIFELIDPVKRIPIHWSVPSSNIQSSANTYKSCILNTKEINDLNTTYTVRSIRLEGNKKLFTLLLLRDYAEVRALQAKLDYLEMHDQRTGLLNRKCFELHLKNALDEARQQGVKHSFIHVALDQFKMINDTVGHNAGDAFIERISDLLKAAITQQRDVLARIGGDEFGILFREIEPIEALKRAENIRQQIESYIFYWNARAHKITASIGFVPIYKRSGTPNRILSLADASCRVAKSKGGNHLHLYRPDDSEVKKHRGQLVWLGRLQKAFEAAQFRLVAQPIQSLSPEKFKLPFHHYEVLLRLFDDNGQPISPNEFIPAAEYYSMMPRLDRWVIHALLQELQRINQKAPLPIFSINLSGQSLDDSTFLEFVQQEIKTAGIDPRMLCFEITERVAISNLGLAQKFIATLKAQGCSFSLDDFGTGVSSFSYLKSLPVDYLKIDGSFIKDILNDGVAHTMVQSIHQVGQKMMVQTIAEYVENERIMQLLRDIGVEYGQGYGISRPVALNDIIESHIIK